MSSNTLAEKVFSTICALHNDSDSFERFSRMIQIEHTKPSIRKSIGDGFYFVSLQDLKEDPNDYPEKVQNDFARWGILFKPDCTELTDLVCHPQSMTAFSDKCNYISVCNPDNYDTYVINRTGDIVITFGIGDYPYFHNNVISCKNKYYNEKGEIICEGECASKVKHLMFIETKKYSERENKLIVLNTITCEIEKTYE